ncbi:AcrR family transcriptional regulator [Crossiella equi]|uniref:AcrR family transcriptional regulator n=1 Tax=Crossiella equi TaxID=130796 RepID=A0ABS5AQH4_9PSEU|nr:TetR/AcrR family transcriptional regulator [Crossiella equi]MBP2478811.1 AcrR family transcriptional regulator [Crossiella equi]
MARPSSRDRILDAYEELLLAQGPATATLDAVARVAEVSKGGLLYHFGSKEALRDGLLERLRRHNEAAIADARAARGERYGLSHFYLTWSLPVHPADAAQRNYMAAIRAATDDPVVRAALDEVGLAWRDAIEEETGDLFTAELVRTIGDGLYLQAAHGTASSELTERVEEVLRRLVGEDIR